MMIEVSALRPLPTVFLRKVISVVRCISLPGQHISAMALIPKDLDDAVCGPLDISKIRFSFKSDEGIRNLLRGVSVEIQMLQSAAWRMRSMHSLAKKSGQFLIL